MLKKYLLLLGIVIQLVLFASAAHCQDLLDVKVEPRPYSYANHVLRKEKPVKSVAYLVKRYYKNKVIETDTVHKELLTKEGKRLSMILFSNHKRNTVSNYEYFSNQNASQWTQKYFDKKNYSYTSKTVKNKAGKDLLYYNTSVLNGDTVSREYAKFEYNGAGLLIKKDNGVDKRNTLTNVYEYKGKDMVMAKTSNKSNTPDFYSAIEYKYNNEHLPIEKKAYLVRHGKADPALYSYFTYEKGLLLKERYQGYDDKAKVAETTVDYAYNSKGQLIKLQTKRDTLYKEIGYEYDNDKIKKVVIKSNTTIYFNREEFIYMNRTVAMPFTYERLFEYDQFGNLILTREFINGEIYMEKISELVYY